METESAEERKALEAVSRIVDPIFKKALQEAEQNQLLVGHIGSERVQVCLWQPHNFRRYYDFSRENFFPLGKGKPRSRGLVVNTHKVLNSTELFYRFNEFSVRVKKSQIQVTNFKDHKRWYPIEVSTAGGKKLAAKVWKKERECLRFLKRFIVQFGGKSELSVLSRHSEDKVKSEKIIDLLPINQKWHTKAAKKVYNDRAVEFSDPALAANYITTAAVNELAPEIAAGLKAVSNRLDWINPLKAIKKNMRCVGDVLKPSIKALVKVLSTDEQEELELWIIKKFGAGNRWK